MWNPEKSLIQIYLGDKAGLKATKFDNRSPFQKWFNLEEEPKQGGLLIKGLTARTRLREKGLYLPQVQTFCGSDYDQGISTDQALIYLDSNGHG